MDNSENWIAIAKPHTYAYYSRYPRGFREYPKEALDLKCPKCGAEEIVILEELPDSRIPGMIGNLAQCWICKHEFRITENCWKCRIVNNR
jgi:hypothetical protein